MPGALILLGDKTTHEGTSANASLHANGGCRSRCGATLIASQQNTPDAV